MSSSDFRASWRSLTVCTVHTLLLLLSSSCSGSTFAGLSDFVATATGEAVPRDVEGSGDDDDVGGGGSEVSKSIEEKLMDAAG